MRYIWLALGVAFLIIGMTIWLQVTRCTTAVTARFVDIRVMKSAWMKDYFPVFQFEFEGVEYTVRCLQSFSGRWLDKNLLLNREYTVYIDPKKPRNVAFYNKPQIADYIVLAIGAVCMLMFLLR